MNHTNYKDESDVYSGSIKLKCCNCVDYYNCKISKGDYGYCDRHIYDM